MAERLAPEAGFPFTIFDCTFANASCARLTPSSPVVVNRSNPPTTGEPNQFTLVDLSNQTTPTPPNAITGNYNFGPFSPNMIKRNAFTGPGFWDFTAGLFKTIRMTERVRLQLRAEVFNVFNHANLYTDFASPDVSSGNVFAKRGVTDTAALERRNVQLAAKIIF